MIVAVVWAVAAVLAIVLGAFCLYELRWKSARLRADLHELDGLVEQLADVQQNLRNTAARLAAVTNRP